MTRVVYCAESFATNTAIRLLRRITAKRGSGEAMKKIIILFGWIVCLNFAMPAFSPAATITARVDHQSMVYGESFELTLQADGAVESQPDFNLLKRDFKIIDVRKSGESTWHLTLQGKRIGIFSVPMIYFGKDRSQAIRVAVKPVSARSSIRYNEKPIILEVEVDVKEAWVQSQVLYTVRLMQSIKLTNVALGAIKTNDPDAIIEKLDAIGKYEKNIDGTPYLVSEIRYAVFPQHSGELVFEPILLQARISTAASRALLNQFMEQGRTKTLQSRKISVKVKPKPAHINTSTWIPANDLLLLEEWSTDRESIRVGEPLTRTITIAASGIPGTQLPDIKPAKVEGIKQYSAPPAMGDEHSSQGIVGARKIRVTVIAAKEGRFIFPAIRLPWWNTVTGKQEIARLNEAVIETSGAVTAKAQDMPPQKPREKKSLVATGQADSPWAWISLALAIAWLTTLLLFMRKGRIDKNRANKTLPAPDTDLRLLEKTVLTEANARHASQCKDALLHWAQARWPNTPCNNLAGIARLCPQQLEQELLALNAFLYANGQGEWSGLRLADTFRDFRQQNVSRSKYHPPELEPLFKSR